MNNTIIIIDYGSQYTQLIARRIRENNVHSIILPYDCSKKDIEKYNIKGFNVGLEYNWNPDNESCEDFITRKGHNITNCEWMVHRDEGVIYPIKT